VIAVVIDQQFILLKWKNWLIDPLKGYVFLRCFLFIRISILLLVFVSPIFNTIRSRLANFKIENLRIQIHSLCGTTLIYVTTPVYLRMIRLLLVRFVRNKKSCLVCFGLRLGSTGICYEVQPLALVVHFQSKCDKLLCSRQNHVLLCLYLDLY